MPQSIRLFGICGFALITSVSATAAPPAFEEALQRKQDIMQQQADAETRRAEAELLQAQTEARRQNNGAGNQSGSYTPVVVPAGDGLAGTDAPTCALTNGSSIRVSGGLRPPAGVQCTKKGD